MTHAATAMKELGLSHGHATDTGRNELDRLGGNHCLSKTWPNTHNTRRYAESKVEIPILLRSDPYSCSYPYYLLLIFNPHRFSHSLLPPVISFHSILYPKIPPFPSRRLPSPPSTQPPSPFPPQQTQPHQIPNIITNPPYFTNNPPNPNPKSSLTHTHIPSRVRHRESVGCKRGMQASGDGSIPKGELHRIALLRWEGDEYVNGVKYCWLSSGRILEDRV